MDGLELKNAFLGVLGQEGIRTGEPMEAHTSMRVGGPADFFLLPSTARELMEVIRICREYACPYFVMGNGSNLVVDDRGYRGAVIRIGRQMGAIRVEDCEISAQAGALLSAIAAVACEHSLTGFEFAAGIPGSLGGACVMNAGAYGGEMKQVLRSVTCLDEDGQVITLSAGELELGYRSSIFMRKPLIALEARLSLARGVREEIADKMAELKGRRQSKQPLELPSSGSTFKRPEGYFAGKLIMDAGLAGCRIGGAQVSEKHCGFIVNTGGARAEDVRQLIRLVQEQVRERFGVTLEPEVRFVGSDAEEQDDTRFAGSDEE